MNQSAPNSKRILCFGDSNTWGYIPGSNAERFDSETRWPGAMQNQLGTGYSVIEEALNGRTTVWNDPLNPNRNACLQLPFILESHTPLDWVIIALGVNDLKNHFHLDTNDIALGVATLAEMVKGSNCGRLEGSGKRQQPELILLSPARPADSVNSVGHKFSGATERHQGLGSAIEQIALQLKCHFFDADKIVSSAESDGIHLDATEHVKLGHAIAEFIRNIESV